MLVDSTISKKGKKGEVEGGEGEEKRWDNKKGKREKEKETYDWDYKMK